MNDSKLFTIAGITTHTGTNVSLTKVRYGTDMIRLVKMLNSSKKIWHTATNEHLLAKRVDLIDLPHAMTKEDALAYLSKHEQFQGASDQAVIQSAADNRSPRSRRTVKMNVPMSTIKERAQAAEVNNSTEIA